MARHKSRVRHTRRRRSRSRTRSRKQAGGIFDLLKGEGNKDAAAAPAAEAPAPVTEAPKEAPKESLGNRFMNFFKTKPAEAEAPKPAAPVATAAGGGRRKKSRKHHRRHRK